MSKLHTLFNHTLTPLQIDDAKNSLGVYEIIEPRKDIKEIWSSIPAEIDDISNFLIPIKKYLSELAEGNYVLIQGDFGAVVLAVEWAKEFGLIPIYSTTERVHREILKDDGSVEMVKNFKHCIYRRY